MIAKLLNISPTAVLYWIKKTAVSLSEPVIGSEVTEVQIDEMWHFLFKKKKNLDLPGFGLCYKTNRFLNVQLKIKPRRLSTPIAIPHKI